MYMTFQNTEKFYDYLQKSVVAFKNVLLVSTFLKVKVNLKIKYLNASLIIYVQFLDVCIKAFCKSLQS